MRAVAAQTPLVFVVEDLHWADASTRGLVSFLAHEIRGDAVLLLVTARAEELDPARPVGVLIGELARMPHAERLVLAPLERAEVAALVEAITGVAPSARLTGQLAQRAAGNPFFTEELLAAGPDALMLPASIRDVLAARAAQLPAAGQRALGAASVLGRAIPATRTTGPIWQRWMPPSPLPGATWQARQPGPATRSESPQAPTTWPVA